MEKIDGRTITEGEKLAPFNPTSNSVIEVAMNYLFADESPE